MTSPQEPSLKSELFIRLYLDADVDMKLAMNLRGLGYDCISAREVGQGETDDESQITIAAGEGRVLLTHNIQDFAPLFELWWQAGRPHAGVIVSQQIPLGELQRRVLRLLNTVAADEMENSFRNLAEFAIK